MLKTCSTPKPGRMAQPGVCGRKHQGRLEADPWGFGVREILAAHEGVQAASEVVGTEAQLLLAP